MKLSKLIIKNIASITDATIDFTINPLKSSELFLITGPTGAGKSTILDCISLALFKNTPRLKNCQMQGKVLDADNKSEINISGPQQLMRSNTVACSATLFFTGNNGVNYKAEWAANRANKKLNGTLSVKWELQNLDDNKILSKNDEGIKKEIQNAIGLDFDQFSRTTMLAQGDFSRFLNSKDEEKAKILEKITGTEIYTNIGKKIFDIKKEKESARDNIKAKMNGVKVLSDEGLQEIIRDQKQKSIELSEKKSQKESLENKKNWLLKEKELQDDLTKKKEAFNDVYNFESPEDYEKAKLQVKDWKATSGPRADMNNIPDIKKGIDEKQGQLDGDLKQRYIKMLSYLKSREKALQEAENSKVKLTKELIKHDSYKEVYTQEQTINAKLDSYNELQGDLVKQNAIIEKCNAELPRLENTHQQNQKLRKKKEEELQKNENKEKELDNKLKALNISELYQQQQSLNNALKSIETVREKYNAFKTAEKQRTEDQKKLEDKKEEIKNSEKKLNSLNNETKELKSVSDDLYGEYQNQCNNVNEWAQKVRQSLKIGDICPVCQQRINSVLPTEEEISALFTKQKNAYEEAYNAYDASKTQASTLVGKLASDNIQYNTDSKRFNEDTALQDCEQALANALKEAGFSAYDENKLDEKEKELKERLEKIGEKLNNGKTIDEKLDKLRKSLPSLRKELDTFKENEHTSDTSLKDNQTKIDSANEKITDDTNNSEDIKKQLKTLLRDTIWEHDWTKVPEDFCAELEERLDNFNKLSRQLNELQSQSEKLDSVIDQLKDVREQITAKVPAYVALAGMNAFTPNSLDDANLKKEANRLLIEISNTCTTLGDKEKELKNKEENIEQFIASNPLYKRADIEALASVSVETINELSETLRKIDSASEALKECREKIEKHKNSKPEFSEQDSIASLTKEIADLDSRYAELNQEFGANKDKLDNNNQALEEVGKLKEKYDTCCEVYNKWEAFCSLIGDSNGKQFCKIAQSYVLANLVHAANGYMKNLSKDRYVLKVIPGTFIILVEDAYEGFHARPASTISGGETFLVSLSLALALSDIGQSLSVDTLFIDEGFGTLSGAPLNDAINTLKSLHSATGRKVGIISHIEQLKNLIPTQIEVSQNIKESKSTITII